MGLFSNPKRDAAKREFWSAKEDLDQNSQREQRGWKAKTGKKNGSPETDAYLKKNARVNEAQKNPDLPWYLR